MLSTEKKNLGLWLFPQQGCHHYDQMEIKKIPMILLTIIVSQPGHGKSRKKYLIFVKLSNESYESQSN